MTKNWINFRFLHICPVEKCEISPNLAKFHILPDLVFGKTEIPVHVEKISDFSTGQMWRNLKFIQFFVIKSVLRCFCEIRFCAIYALLRGEKFCKKLVRWRKNYKYQVCALVAFLIQYFGTFYMKVCNPGTKHNHLYKEQRFSGCIRRLSFLLRLGSALHCTAP